MFWVQIMDWFRRFYRKKRQISSEIVEESLKKNDEFVDIVEGEEVGGLEDLIRPEVSVESNGNKDTNEVATAGNNNTAPDMNSSTPADSRPPPIIPKPRRSNTLKSVQNYPKRTNTNTTYIIHQPR